jgi:hypothetical protein
MSGSRGSNQYQRRRSHPPGQAVNLLAQTAAPVPPADETLLALQTLERTVGDRTVSRVLPAVASTPGISPELFDYLAAKAISYAVRGDAAWWRDGVDTVLTLVRNEHCPLSTIRTIINSPLIQEYRVASALLCYPSCPAEAFPQFVQNRNLNIRVTAASHPNCPPEVLEAMAQTGTVRRAVAGNPRTPVAVLEQLLADQDSAVSQTAAANPSLPRATLAMWQLARNT